MKSLKNLVAGGLIAGLTAIAIGCSPPRYEKADIAYMLNYPAQYVNRDIEVQGKTLDPNNGLLALGKHYISPAIQTDLRKNKKRQRRVMDIMQKQKLIYPDRIVIKGRFNNDEVLEIKQGFFEAGSRKYDF